MNRLDESPDMSFPLISSQWSLLDWMSKKPVIMLQSEHKVEIATIQNLMRTIIYSVNTSTQQLIYIVGINLNNTDYAMITLLRGIQRSK